MNYNRLKHIFLYKPYWPYFLTDIILLGISFFIVLMWFPLSTQIPFQKYDRFAYGFSLMWILCSYLSHRYVPVKYMKMSINIYRLLAAAVAVFVFIYTYMTWVSHVNYSIWVLLTILLAVFLTNLLCLVVFHAYRYALNAEPEIKRAPKRGPQTVLNPPCRVDEHSADDIRKTVEGYISKPAFTYLSKFVDFFSTNTFVILSSDLFNFINLHYFRYDVIVNLMPLNQVRGINKMFGVVNDKLPDNGLFVCCFESKSVRKKRILQKYPAGINYVFYSFDFLLKRVIPKVFMTSRLYYDITEGKNRVLSKSEVLGRLCYCGFEIVDEHKQKDWVYVVARRSFRPFSVQQRMYGMFVKLNRVGKNGQMFKVYKFRTMHPYSEYLQAYIYKNNHLQEGGKFNHDIRITTLGRFMRRCWFDELPMLLNLLKGNMKLVGVRPISRQYYELYSKELQQKRTKFKPGLLPPFYADMPKTLEEIEASEMKYLVACEQDGILKTDFRYLWKILDNIIFKHARSK